MALDVFVNLQEITPFVWTDTVRGGAGIHPSADSLSNYADKIFVGRGWIDSRPPINDQIAGKFTLAVRPPTDAMSMADAIYRHEGMNTSFTNWVTEELGGNKNGTNQSFTVSHTPNVASMSVFSNGIRFVRVAGTPTSGEAQYGVSGTTVILGLPPPVGSWVVSRYFWEH